MKRFFWISAVTLLWMVVMFSGMAGNAGAQPAEGGPDAVKIREERQRQHFIEMSERLRLSPEQQAKLDENRKRHKAELEQIRAQMSAKRQELRKVLEEPQLDLQRVRQKHDELKEIIIRKEDQRLQAILEIRNILTPEQFSQFQDMWQSKRRRDLPPESPPDGNM